MSLNGKRIRFSGIKEIKVTERYDGEGSYDHNTELIIVGRNPQKISSEKDSEMSKELATRLCRIIGVNGYYFDEKKNLTMLTTMLTLS